jgi:uncharacterized membrane protein
MLTRNTAQQRVEEIHQFRRELGRLDEAGVLVLSAEQQNTVRGYHDDLMAEYTARFDVDRNSQASQLSLGMRVASFLGAMALAAGVFFLFYQFWGLFSVSAQVGILLTSALLSFGFAVWLPDPTGYFSKLAALVAFVCFVLNVVMLGQIFNLTPSDKALLPWAGLAFVLAYACKARLLLVAGILCLMAFIAARVGTWSGLYWIHFGEYPETFFPMALATCFAPYLISRPQFADFDPMYRIFGLLGLFLPMLVLAHWGEGSYLTFEPDFIERSYQVAGFVVSALFVWLGIRQQHRDMVNTATTFFVIFLYTKLFDWWWDAMPKYLFFMLLGLVALLLLFILKNARQRLTGVNHA